MINPFKAMQVATNPQAFLQQQLQQRMTAMMKQNPQAFQKMQEMVGGKSEEQMKETFMNMAKEQGIDVKKFASQFGITL